MAQKSHDWSDLIPESLTLDPTADPADLAAQIVALPDGTDLGSDCVGNLGRVLLTGKPEERDPGKYARVFDRVRESSLATPWMRSAAWAESINGRRRCKGADMSSIADELGELARVAARELSDGPEKHLLLGGIAYNLGIVCRGLRRYVDEARAQRESASWFGLAGNPAKHDTSLFAAQVGVVSAAFAGDIKMSDPFLDPTDKAIHQSCGALVAARDFVTRQAYKYPAWMADNASLHIGFALMMGHLMEAIPEDALNQHADDFKAGEGSRFAHWKKVFETWRLYQENDFDAVIAASLVDTVSSSFDNTALTMRLLAALSKRRHGDASGAKEILESVANHSGPDGGIPITVAKKFLAK